LLQQTQVIVKKTIKSNSKDTTTLEGLRKRQFEYLLEFIRNAVDVPIPVTALNSRVAQAIPTGVVGLCGVVSSLIGIYQVWMKTK
jgi:hypothetical protein